MTTSTDLLPDWLMWQPRPFPDSNLTLLTGPRPALIDSGFVGHAPQTTLWVNDRTDHLSTVVNTHWHADHVGGNHLLQKNGAEIAASAVDADALRRRDPGCCQAEYLDQPVSPYTVDTVLTDDDVLQLGDRDWQVIATPGHTPGHLCLWQPEHRFLAVGDALSTFDVGWVNTALHGHHATQTALTSLRRLADLAPEVILPAHGPLITDPHTAISAGLRRAQRLVDDPDGAVWYGLRRIFAFALMIRNGIDNDDVETYLLQRRWLTDAARQLRLAPSTLADELVTSMISSGAINSHESRLHAAAEHSASDAGVFIVPFPRRWP